MLACIVAPVLSCVVCALVANMPGYVVQPFVCIICNSRADDEAVTLLLTNVIGRVVSAVVQLMSCNWSLAVHAVGSLMLKNNGSRLDSAACMNMDKAYGFLMSACRPLPEYLKTEIALALRTEAYAPDEVSDACTHSYCNLSCQSDNFATSASTCPFAKELA